MTSHQTQALWELCRQGLPLAADEAAERWRLGQAFELQPRVRIARSVQALIELCNWETRPTAEPA